MKLKKRGFCVKVCGCFLLRKESSPKFTNQRDHREKTGAKNIEPNEKESKKDECARVS